MSILDEIRTQEAWQDFLAYQKDRDRLSVPEEEQLRKFIEEKRYLPITAAMAFPLPAKRLIARPGSSKKRVVYCYPEDETRVLKLVAFLLYRYDGRFAEGCCAFRRNVSAAAVLKKIAALEDLDGRFVLKLDIHDYFNSIDTDLLGEMLGRVIDDDPALLAFLESLLKQDACIFAGREVQEKRGAMAGVPVASFFANVYLMDLDEQMEQRGITYYRYSDDMLMLCRSEEEKQQCLALVEEVMREKKLELNPDKQFSSGPGEPFPFLGCQFDHGKIDLSDGAVAKLKRHIRRKAHKLHRQKEISWKKKARALIATMDHYFYDFFGTRAFTWSRYYFPVLSSDRGLKEIDAYMLEYLRYLYSGRHCKGNFAVSYQDLKKLGYTSLVHEFHTWRKEEERLRKQRS